MFNNFGGDTINSKEIAKLAGVSRSTVSRVLNNYSNVPEETRKRVLDVVNKYKYVPHASARALAGVKSKIIGLFMIDKKSDTDGLKVSMSSYFSPFMNGVIDHANKRGYHVLAYAVGKPEDYQNVRKVFYDKTISGGIFIGQQNDSDIDDIIKDGYKAVLIDKDDSGDQALKKSIVVNADNFYGAYEATKYLIGLNHKKIAHITGYTGQLSTIERLEGYKKALQDSGIAYDSNFVVKGNFLKDSGYHATNKLLEQCKPTAIFYANDSMAIGGIQALEEKGLHVPEDISVVGFDDIELASYIRPALTTVRMPLGTMASSAVDALINSIESGTGYSARYTIPVELIERESCRKIDVE